MAKAWLSELLYCWFSDPSAVCQTPACPEGRQRTETVNHSAVILVLLYDGAELAGCAILTCLAALAPGRRHGA